VQGSKQLDVFHLAEEANRLREGDNEIHHRPLVERAEYRAGIVVFRPLEKPPANHGKPQEITHPDLDVLAHVVEGSGTITVRGKSETLFAGQMLYLPAGTPHDFSAGGEDLVLFYAQIHVREV
jgi:quercetin dioxygenase-like cupin family protein